MFVNLYVFFINTFVNLYNCKFIWFLFLLNIVVL